MVCYEDLARNPDRTIRRLRKALDMEGPVEFVEFRNPDTRREHLRKIETPVRFYSYDEDLEIPSELRRLYREIVA